MEKHCKKSDVSCYNNMNRQGCLVFSSLRVLGISINRLHHPVRFGFKVRFRKIKSFINGPEGTEFESSI